MWRTISFFMTVVCLCCVVFGLTAENAAAQQKVVGVIVYDNNTTPNRRTQEAFVKNAHLIGWETIMVNSSADFGKIRVTFDEFIAKDVDAIVICQIDPKMIQDSLEKAKSVGIPVVGIAAGYDPNVTMSVVAHDYMMSAQITTHLLDTMRQKGLTQLLVTNFAYHFGTRARYEVLQTILLDYPEIEILAEHQIIVPGEIERAEAWMTEFLNAHPDFEGGVWNAWDEPATGILGAIDKLGRKNIYVIGFDASWLMLERMRRKTPDDPFIGTETHPVEWMGKVAAELLKEVFDGVRNLEDVPPVVYIPSALITPKNVPDEGWPWDDMGNYKEEYGKLAIFPNPSP